jgi:hypothetical protein
MGEPSRWINQSQPQTLYMAQVLLYIGAALTLLFGGFASVIGLAFVAAGAGAAYGIANEKRWGYYLGLAFTGLRVLFLLIFLVDDFGLLVNLNFLISAVVPVGLFLLLMHPQSREYQRIWFR